MAARNPASCAFLIFSSKTHLPLTIRTILAVSSPPSSTSSSSGEQASSGSATRKPPQIALPFSLLAAIGKKWNWKVETYMSNSITPQELKERIEFGSRRLVPKLAGVSRNELPLPEPFLEFLSQNGLDLSIYAASQSTPRYIRLKPGCKLEVAEIEAGIKCKLEEVPWLHDFYYLPPDVRIASTKAYQEGKIYGIDAASGAAVLALDITSGDHVLDLCAAPGAKLCMILDLLGCSGTVTGVDIARHRLAASRTMVQKYDLGDQCRLFVADGTTFSLAPLRAQSSSESVGNGEVEENSETYNEWTSRRPWKQRKRIAKASKTFSQIQEPELIFYGRNSGVVGLSKDDVFRKVDDHEISQFGYDKVLVDAECTHDGSVKHIQKFEQWGWTTLQRRVLDAERTDDLTVLQLKLLTNGFRLLKVGGSLVYSTCSLTVAQNEDVVESFLSEHASAKLLEIDASKKWPCGQARIPNTLRFDPLTSSTSGLFVAKFTKLNA